MVFHDHPFQFAVIGVSGASITTTATVTVNEILNGTIILCKDGNLVIPDLQNNTVKLIGE